MKIIYPTIGEKQFEMFKMSLAVVMLQVHNSNPDKINEVFGRIIPEPYYDAEEHEISCSNNGLELRRLNNTQAKISTWNIKKNWGHSLESSVMYFITEIVDSEKIVTPSTAYYMSSYNSDQIHVMNNTPVMIDIPGYMEVRTMRLDSPHETYFQNSTMQCDLAQYYSVWRFYADTFSKYHNIDDFHFYSILEYESVKAMYDQIPKGMWTTMADMHHDFFMANYGHIFIS